MPSISWKLAVAAGDAATGPSTSLEHVEVVDRVLEQGARAGLGQDRPARSTRSCPGSGCTGRRGTRRSSTRPLSGSATRALQQHERRRVAQHEPDLVDDAGPLDRRRPSPWRPARSTPAASRRRPPARARRAVVHQPGVLGGPRADVDGVAASRGPRPPSRTPWPRWPARTARARSSSGSYTPAQATSAPDDVQRLGVVRGDQPCPEEPHPHGTSREGSRNVSAFPGHAGRAAASLAGAPSLAIVCRCRTAVGNVESARKVSHLQSDSH